MYGQDSSQGQRCVAHSGKFVFFIFLCFRKRRNAHSAVLLQLLYSFSERVFIWKVVSQCPRIVDVERTKESFNEYLMICCGLKPGKRFVFVDKVPFLLRPLPFDDLELRAHKSLQEVTRTNASPS